MHFSSHKKDCKKFKSNNKSIALNMLYVAYNTEEIRHAYKSIHNLKCENQVILIITDNEKWHYLAVKKLCTLLCKTTSKHDGDFICLNCLHLFKTKKDMNIYAKITTTVIYKC